MPGRRLRRGVLRVRRKGSRSPQPCGAGGRPDCTVRAEQPDEPASAQPRPCASPHSHRCAGSQARVARQGWGRARRSGCLTEQSEVTGRRQCEWHAAPAPPCLQNRMCPHTPPFPPIQWREGMTVQQPCCWAASTGPACFRRKRAFTR